MTRHTLHTRSDNAQSVPDGHYRNTPMTTTDSVNDEPDERDRAVEPANVGTSDRWIATAEALPPMTGQASHLVLGIDQHGCYRVYWLGTDGAGGSLWHPAVYHPPTHWRSLPQPPDGEGSDPLPDQPTAGPTQAVADAIPLRASPCAPPEGKKTIDLPIDQDTSRGLRPLVLPEGQHAIMPCPFCGGVARVDGTRPDMRHRGFWIVCAECCSAGTEAGTVNRAISQWNRRTQPLDVRPSVAPEGLDLRTLFSFADDAFGPRWEQIDAGDRNEVILDRWLETIDDVRCEIAKLRAQADANAHPPSASPQSAPEGNDARDAAVARAEGAIRGALNRAAEFLARAERAEAIIAGEGVAHVLGSILAAPKPPPPNDGKSRWYTGEEYVGAVYWPLMRAGVFRDDLCANGQAYAALLKALADAAPAAPSPATDSTPAPIEGELPEGPQG